jgi:DNA-binding HxlR family transcriptional regulator
MVLPRMYDHLNCSIARTLEVLGDRWTLLVVRNLLVGTTRFDDFQRRLEIAPNVLADRLNRLVDEGIVERHRYQEHPVRYEYCITDKGRDLWGVLAAMVEWGDRYHAPHGPPRVLVHDGCGGQVVQELTCSECHSTLNPRELSTRLGPGAQRAF